MNDAMTAAPAFKSAPSSAGMDQFSAQEMRLLRLLSKRFPNVAAAHAEMINLHAILALPKGTDHFISDIHGAYDQFDHMLRHGSGVVSLKVEQTFGIRMTARRKGKLVTLICYPRKSLRQWMPTGADKADWMAETIAQLIQVARVAARKYTRSKIRKRLPKNHSYIMEELLSDIREPHRELYCNTIIRSIVEMGEGENFIISLARFTQICVTDRLVVLGDVYDRGPEAEKVMDRLIAYPHVEFLWGNHDVIWMGAASGSAALVAQVTRISLRYGNLPTLEGAYEVSMKRLAEFAAKTYEGPCADTFKAKAMPSDDYPAELLARMHKAITMIQFKLEEQIIARHPEYEMGDRLLLGKVNREAASVDAYGKTHPMLDANLPTLDPANPSALTPEEQEVIDDMVNQFRESARLTEHVQFLYARGGMYRALDGNLLYHGCLPVDDDGEFVEFELDGERLSGHALLARYEQVARNAWLSPDAKTREAGQDAMWYLWNGAHSPLFGKARMTTFERYFIADKETHTEPKSPYYKWRLEESFCRKVLAAFGCDPDRGIIINGHVPVKVKKGESPVKANGKLVVIDGGMSKAYQSETGIAGYTLMRTSNTLVLAEHQPFTSPEQMIANEQDISPKVQVLQHFPERLHNGDTDVGVQLSGELEDLQKLVHAYRDGILPESRD
jgi:fructose-1,6-bisphosphatase-3